MKENELREIAQCAICNRPFGHTGLPLFWRITVERFSVDMGAIQRQDGLAALLGGNSLLAGIMGPDNDMAEPMMDAITITVCESCAMEDQICIAALAEA